MPDPSTSSHPKPEPPVNDLKPEVPVNGIKPETTATPTNGDKGTSKRLTNGENLISLTDLRVEVRTLDNKIALHEKSFNEKIDTKIDALEKTINVKFDSVNERINWVKNSLDSLKSYFAVGLITIIATVVGGILLLYFK
jgi:hypothetical protein